MSQEEILSPETMTIVDDPATIRIVVWTGARERNLAVVLNYRWKPKSKEVKRR